MRLYPKMSKMSSAGSAIDILVDERSDTHLNIALSYTAVHLMPMFVSLLRMRIITVVRRAHLSRPICF